MNDVDVTTLYSHYLCVVALMAANINLADSTADDAGIATNVREASSGVIANEE